MNPFRPHPALSPIVLVGPGRMGKAIARAAAAAGLEANLAGRSDLPQAVADAEVVLLCVPDGEIRNAARHVAELAPRIRFLGHTSGATGLEALAETIGSGATFSMHPLQTVPDGTSELAGAPAAVSGSNEEALGLARALAESLGMTPFALPEDARAAYHAAASMASNFLVALEESAVELLTAAGVGGGRALLTPLVTRTTANWAERGHDALTGPIARGDERTVRAHTEAIEALAPQLKPLYEALAERTRALAREGDEVPA